MIYVTVHINSEPLRPLCPVPKRKKSGVKKMCLQVFPVQIFVVGDNFVKRLN